MEDFGNIVYVLAAIGWFLWKTFGKSSEKNAPQPKRSRPKPVVQEAAKPVASTLDELFEQFGVDTKEVRQPKKQPVSAEPVKAVRRPSRIRNRGFLNVDLTHSHLADDYQMSSGEMQSHRVERQVRVLEAEHEETETLMDRLMPNGFDLRQAVVFDAVLNRPYS